MKFQSKSGVEVRVTCLANPHLYLSRKERPYLESAEGGRNEQQAEIPQLHTTGQPKPPEGHCWAGEVDVGVGIFFHPTLQFLCRQGRLKPMDKQTNKPVLMVS